MRHGYADTAGGQVHYRESGGSGPVIVMLHQTASSSRMFEALAPHLDGYRVIALDTPGFGASDRLPGTPTVERYADALASAVDALGIGAHVLLGHHTGAAIATRWAADRPERVRALILFGALGMGAEERERWRAGIPVIRIEESGEHLRAAWERVAAIDAVPVRYAPDAELRHRETVDMLTAGPRWTEAYEAVFAQDYESALAAVRSPTLLVCGTDDILRPYVEATAALNALVETVIPPGGAYLPDQEPAAMAELISSFIEGPAGGPEDPHHTKETA